MRYFQYTNTVRDLDNKLRPWEDHDALCYYDMIHNSRDSNYDPDYESGAIEIKNEERSSLQKRVQKVR